MKALQDIKNMFSYKQKVFLIVCAGIVIGLGALFLYLLRAHTYIADDSSACVNCHIMTRTPLMVATPPATTATCLTRTWP